MQISKFVLTVGMMLGAIASAQVVEVAAVRANAQDQYGAIATSEAGSWGYAYNYPTRAQAEAQALNQCGTNDCFVRVWFKNACGAVAQNNNNTIGWGWATSRQQAEAQAIRAVGTGDTRIVSWACTDR
ncbi:DUF4189 domain-containing protein [Pseudanabaenaceae cyanobacterium LEGE 13415]|nr:DUF4189 domain-containing protein [Pseudanabaenaceae cyanobacterium LEGE 13415]